jgi:hypothetical protein
MSLKLPLLVIPLLFGRAVAARTLDQRGTWQCCHCSDNCQSAAACADVNFGLCGNSNGACGIWVGHANDITDFANACVAQGSSFGECS